MMVMPFLAAQTIVEYCRAKSGIISPSVLALVRLAGRLKHPSAKGQKQTTRKLCREHTHEKLSFMNQRTRCRKLINLGL